MLDDIFKISREFLRIFYRPYKRYFLVKYPLSGRFSIITGQFTDHCVLDIGHRTLFINPKGKRYG